MPQSKGEIFVVHIIFYSSNLKRNFENIRFKVIDDECHGEPDLNSDDITDKVSWDCQNGFTAGTTCQKVCGPGTRLSAWKRTKTCECTGKCQWKGAVASCIPAFCKERV